MRRAPRTQTTDANPRVSDTPANLPGTAIKTKVWMELNGRFVLEQLMAVRTRIDDAVGPSGPTPKDIAARGRRPTRRVADARSRTARGDWRTRR